MVGGAPIYTINASQLIRSTSLLLMGTINKSHCLESPGKDTIAIENSLCMSAVHQGHLDRSEDLP